MRSPKKPVAMEELRRAYAAGENLMARMRHARDADLNDEDAILHSYDLQAGSYVGDMAIPALAASKKQNGEKLAALFTELGATVIGEAGVGEATTLSSVLTAAPFVRSALGFDISLSRLLHARAYLASCGHPSVDLFTATLEAIPLPDDSVDLLYTFHSMEPNGGREVEILQELLRVTAHHLVLVEPSSELGSEETRSRIEQHKYVRDLRAHLDRLGCKVTRHELWGLDVNPKNQAALIVVEKRPREAATTMNAPQLASPLSRKPLVRRADCLYSREDGRAYPIIGGIPCLLVANGIVATQLEHFGAT
jgi:uncharacterized protein YbaR (Trm112 family)